LETPTRTEKGSAAIGVKESVAWLVMMPARLSAGVTMSTATSSSTKEAWVAVNVTAPAAPATP
jgi:hypothetical protein